MTKVLPLFTFLSFALVVVVSGQTTQGNLDEIEARLKVLEEKVKALKEGTTSPEVKELPKKQVGNAKELVIDERQKHWREAVAFSELIKTNGITLKKSSRLPFTGWVKDVYAGKQFVVGRFVSGKEEGHWTIWHENGEKFMNGYWKAGKEEGLWTFWHDNGQKDREGYWKDGKLDGPLTIWYKNGQKSAEGVYKADKRHGLWIGYREDGTESSRTIYRNGVKFK